MECEKKEYQLQAVCFAAGTAVFIACLEQAVVRSFIEQWRVLMFLALNLLLLAILFTSTCPILSQGDVQASNDGDEQFKLESKKRRNQCGSMEFGANEVGGDRLKHLKSRSKRDDEKVIVEVDVKKEVITEDDLKGQEIDEFDVKEQAFQLIKEELNERAEAFIAMFRQHLISDAKERSCRRPHSPLKRGDNVLPQRKPLYASHVHASHY